MCGYCGFSGFETAITAKTAETARYIQRIYSLIFREKGFWNGFLRTFEEG